MLGKYMIIGYLDPLRGREFSLLDCLENVGFQFQDSGFRGQVFHDPYKILTYIYIYVFTHMHLPVFPIDLLSGRLVLCLRYRVWDFFIWPASGALTDFQIEHDYHGRSVTFPFDYKANSEFQASKLGASFSFPAEVQSFVP